MSSVPIYAINTSCRSADCSHRWPYTDGGKVALRPPNIATVQPPELKQPANQGRTRSYSNSSDGVTPPTSPIPQVDTKLRSSSLNHLDRASFHPPPSVSPLASKSCTTYPRSNDRERIMDLLGVFN